VALVLMPVLLSGQNKYIPPDPYTNWDGITHWSKYQISSPGYFGPNALPVPEIHKAFVPETLYWSGMYECYSGDGDVTHDLKTHFIIPVVKSRVGLEFKYVPVELYSMDSAVSHERRTVSGTSVNGTSFGDIYFGAIIQVIRDHRGLPDFSLSMNCKTASGTDRNYSRYTDAPGYFFGASMGDSYGNDKDFFRHVRWYAELGFFCWQTNLDNYPQNDALLFGAGFDFDFRDFYLNQSISGYSGYMNNGDQPLVYRVDFGIKTGKSAIVFGYEKGIHDFPFQSIRAGIQINGATFR